jgi:hypothetical protein
MEMIFVKCCVGAGILCTGNSKGTLLVTTFSGQQSIYIFLFVLPCAFKTIICIFFQNVEIAK